MQLIPKMTPAIAPSTPANLPTLTFDVGGMKCAGCVKAVETALLQQPGVRSATVNLVTEVALVECDRAAVNPVELAAKLTEAGFPSQPRWGLGEAPAEAADQETPAQRQQRETTDRQKQLAIAALLLVLSAVGHLSLFNLTIPGLSNIWFHCGLATLALIFPGRAMIVDGWRGARRNAPNMNTLVSLGTITAYTTSLVALLFPTLGWECFFDEPVMLVGFILLGRTLEQQARSRAAASLQSLVALQPAIAKRILNDEVLLNPARINPAQTVELPTAQVTVGDWLQVLPGEKMPVDGEITLGQTTVDESMLTGEATPVFKQPGAFVAAGTLNQTGAIAIRATRTGKDTTLAQIIALVETAQTRKAPIQGLADTVAGYFTYGVLAIALFTFLFWYFVGTPLWGSEIGSLSVGIGHMAHMAPAAVSASPMSLVVPPSPLLLSLKLAIAVLVIACPCALGLATPTAILVGSGVGAERGLLIRGGDVLEKVHQLQTIVFDKTGTLTTGHPSITDCVPVGNALSASQLLQLAATVESGTNHPLALAIRQQAEQQSLPLLQAKAFLTEPGMGVSAQVDGQLIQLGKPEWLAQNGVNISPDVQPQAAALASTGKTVIYIGADSVLVGIIAAQDTLRPDAVQTVTHLRQMGMRLMLLTGDHPLAAEAIARPLGFAPAEIQAGVSPQGKVEAIARLKASGTPQEQVVAMIGDGINDAPALAEADVSLSLHSGTDAAIEASEIVLMRDRLTDVVEAVYLSRAIFNKIRQNLFWAFAYNVLGIPVAAGILLPSLGISLNPSAAGALMALSSVSVLTNSLLLRRTPQHISQT